MNEDTLLSLLDGLTAPEGDSAPPNTPAKKPPATAVSSAQTLLRALAPYLRHTRTLPVERVCGALDQAAMLQGLLQVLGTSNPASDAKGDAHV